MEARKKLDALVNDLCAAVHNNWCTRCAACRRLTDTTPWYVPLDARVAAGTWNIPPQRSHRA